MSVSKRGRPCTYTQEVGDEICRRLAEGDTVEANMLRDPGCRAPRAPCACGLSMIAGVRKMARQALLQRMRARSVGLQKLADELIWIF